MTLLLGRVTAGLGYVADVSKYHIAGIWGMD